LHHVGFVVADIEGVRDFYVAHGGWTCTYDAICDIAASETIGRVIGFAPGVVRQLRLMTVQTPCPGSGGMVEYLQVIERTKAPEGAPAPAKTVLSHAVRDIDTAWAALTSEGAEVVCEPSSVSFANVEAFIGSVRHLDDAVVEVVQFATP
jgi:catechol 2,3-dioxygenase-like lactoylglutathione lyase family enzyme